MLALLLLDAVLAAAPPDLSAQGVVVSPRAQASVAIVRAGARTRIVSVGDQAFGGRVLAIGTSGVWLEFADGRRQARLAPALGDAPPPLSLAAAPSEPPSQETPAARSFERREVERRIAADLNRILAETTLTPVLDGAVITGFTLSKLPEGTVLSDAGLRAGDVLTRINDVPVDSMATLLSLWPRLQSANELKAVVLRDGRPLTLTVNLH